MIQLQGFRSSYLPGEELALEFRIQEIDPSTIVTVETSVVWYTEGKGSEDLGVHFFQRLTGEAVSERDWTQPQPIATELPYSPLSYEGRLLKIRWCIRVRVYLNDGNELVGQESFSLGS